MYEIVNIRSLLLSTGTFPGSSPSLSGSTCLCRDVPRQPDPLYQHQPHLQPLLHDAMSPAPINNINNFSPDLHLQYYVKPSTLTASQKIKKFLWDQDEKRVLGRTAASWAKIGLFYLIFYGVLAGLVAICMWVFFQTLDPRIPKWRLDESVIGTNPGLGFRPMPSASNVESTLIWFRGTEREDYRYWAESLEEFLAVYKTPGLTPGRGQNIYDCDYDRHPGTGQVCDVEVKKWHPCTQENNFNFHKSAPCIFLKLNKIYGWQPEFFNNSQQLPEEMPISLKEYITDMDQKGNKKRLDTIWVSCEGESPADIENIGPIDYIPERGFQGYFYPYQNSEGYLSPLVAVHFRRPRTGILINVECKAWAKNIKYSRADRLGSVHFELMID